MSTAQKRRGPSPYATGLITGLWVGVMLVTIADWIWQ